MAFTTNQEIVAEYYIAALGRSPEMAGLDYWVGRLEATDETALTAAQIRDFFLDTNIAEVAERFPTLDAATLVSSVYTNVFGRAADAGGQTYWEGRLDGTTGTLLTMPELVSTMLAVAQDPALSNTVDAAYVASLITAAEVSYDAEYAAANPVIGQTFTLTANTDISGVILGSAGTTSTANNDTITATNTTYTTGDVLVGGEGTDTLNLALTATNAGLATVVGVENINVNVTSFAATTFDATNVTAVGTTITVNNLQTAGTTAATITNLGTGATVAAGTGVTGTLAVTTTTQATQTLTLAANSATTQTVTLHGTAGLTDVATVAAAGTVALDTTGTGQIETVNLSGNGAAATYAITGVATTYNLTGSQSVTLAGNESSFDGKTITDSTTAGTTTLSITTAGASDLSKATVDLIDLTVADAALAYTVRAGQAIKISDATTTEVTTFDISDNTTANVTGAITVELTGVLTTGKGIALNATTTDDHINALTITNNTVAQATAKVVAINADVTLNGTKAVTLETGSTAKTLNASGLSASLVAIAGTNITSIIGGTANDTITMTTAETATIDGGAGTDRVKITADIDALTMSNVEILELTGAITAAKLSTLSGKSYIVTGASAIDFGVINANLDTSTIDLSGLVMDTATSPTSVVVNVSGGLSTALYTSTTGVTFTGSSIADTVTGTDNADTISAGAGDDIIVGGAGNDTITAGEGADAVTGGAGNDTISLTETTAAIDNVVFGATAAANGVDTITGFALANDTLNLSAFENAAGDEVLIATGAMTTTAATVYYLGGLTAGSADTAAAAATAITAGATWTSASVTAWVVLSDDNSTAIYEWAEAGTAGAQTAELTLVGTVDAVMTSTQLATAITVA